MSNETAGAAPATEIPTDGAVLALQNVYLKDCSYESPNGPRVDGNWNPQISLDLQTGSNALGPDVREVVLTVAVSAKLGGVTNFLVEVKQGGRLADRAGSGRNERCLASAQFPDSLQVEPELATALAASRDVLIVVPSHAFRSLLAELAPHLAPELHIAWATKGFEHGSLKLPH